LLELENHLSVVPVRDVQVLWVNYIERFMKREPPVIGGNTEDETATNKADWFRTNELNQSKLDPAMKEEILRACFGEFSAPKAIQKPLNTGSPTDGEVLYKQAKAKFSKVEPFDEIVGLNLLLELEKHMSELGSEKISQLWESYFLKGLEAKDFQFIPDDAIKWFDATFGKSTLPVKEKEPLRSYIVKEIFFYAN
jgi:hypothetical protein